MEGAQIAVDQAHRSAFPQPPVDKIAEMSPFDLAQFLDAETLHQETPDAQMAAPKGTDALFNAGFAPVALAHNHVLVERPKVLRELGLTSQDNNHQI